VGFAIKDQVDILNMYLRHLVQRVPVKEAMQELAEYLYQKTFSIPKELENFYAARTIKYFTWGYSPKNPLIVLYSKNAHTWVEDTIKCIPKDE
jgi:hypothetical protein